MRKRQASIADHIMEAQALLDGRYRLDEEIRRSATTTVHLATHRNGSTAWLKMPLLAAHAEQIALESRIANTIGSPLLVRDDGTTPEGMPYLILDPPTAEPLKELRARGKAGARMPLPRAMTAGDSLARVVASIHAIGYVTGGLDDEDVLVFDNADVALLDLHAVTAVTPEGVAADVKRLLRALTALIEDVTDAGDAKAAIDAMLAGSYGDIATAQEAWRKASPEPILTPIRARSGSFPDLVPPSSRTLAKLATPDTPFGLTVGNEAFAAPPESSPQNEESIIGYLRSADEPVVAAPRPRERVVMYDPLSKVAEVSRLVQATSRTQEEPKRRSRSAAFVGALVAVPLLALAVAGGVLVTRGDAGSPSVAAGTTLSAPVTTSVNVVAPVNAAPAAPAAKAAAAAVIELTPSDTAAAAAAPAPAPVASDELEDTATLRTANAPPGRDVLLDGKSIGKTPLDATTVPCGTHTLQMSVGATKQTIELPCGSERTVKYDAKGHWALK